MLRAATYLDGLHGNLTSMFIQVFLQVQVAILEYERQLLFLVYNIVQPARNGIKVIFC